MLRFIVFRLTEPLFFLRAFKFCSNCAASRQRGLSLGASFGGSWLAHALMRGGSGDAIGAVFLSGTKEFLWFVLSMTLDSMAKERTFSGGLGDVGVMLISFST